MLVLGNAHFQCHFDDERRLIAERESAELAEELIATTCVKQGILREQLTVHADNGASMIAQSLMQLYSELGITPSHSRPHVSNDNPYSKAHFKTIKYRPDYPERFGSAPDARQWAEGFFTWYNHEHHHSALGLLTPAVVHYGQAAAVLGQRQRCCRPPTLPIPNGLSKDRRFPPGCPRRSGSIGRNPY